MLAETSARKRRQPWTFLVKVEHLQSLELQGKTDQKVRRKAESCPSGWEEYPVSSKVQERKVTLQGTEVITLYSASVTRQTPVRRTHDVPVIQTEGMAVSVGVCEQAVCKHHAQQGGPDAR